MQALFSTFGVDWRLLLIQGVNFAILLAGLWYFLYAPMKAMLEERRKKVAQGVKAAQAAEAKLKEIEAARAAALAQAGREADEVLAAARAAGAKKEHELAMHAQAQAAMALAEAQAQAKELKARALDESKQEVAKLIVLGMERAMTK